MIATGVVRLGPRGVTPQLESFGPHVGFKVSPAPYMIACTPKGAIAIAVRIMKPLNCRKMFFLAFRK